MAIHHICNSCGKRIFPVSPRFHCLVCPDSYDACQACHHAARHVPPHESSHTFCVMHGQTTSPPPPTAALGTLTISQPPPPPPPPPLPFRSPPNPPPLPPRQLSSPSSSNTTPQSPHSPHSPWVWGPLLTPQQHTPTHHLHRLADAAFHHFSTQGGAPSSPPSAMTPEQLARFYTAMGRSGSTNFPDLFHTLMAQYGATLDPSDAQIAFVFQEYAYAFTLATRPGSSIPNGMPLLLLDGFRRMLTDEVLEDPEEAWRGFNTLLVGVPELGLAPAGPIPRACFPDREDRAARARGDRISAVLVERSRAMFERLEAEAGAGAEAEREAQREREAGEALAASRVRIELEQRGMDNCLGGWRVDEWGNEYYDQGLI